MKIYYERIHPTNPNLQWVERWGAGGWEVKPCVGNELPDLGVFKKPNMTFVKIAVKKIISVVKLIAKKVKPRKQKVSKHLMFGKYKPPAKKDRTPEQLEMLQIRRRKQMQLKRAINTIKRDAIKRDLFDIASQITKQRHDYWAVKNQGKVTAHDQEAK